MNKFPERVLDDRWIRQQRPAKNPVQPDRAYLAFVEQEVAASGNVVDVAALFLTNSECPFTCLMCDLWRNTLDRPTPAGAIPAQIRRALAALPPAQHIKLYNSGNFFDGRAVPADDLPAIAHGVSAFKHVIVENHPALVSRRVLDFRDRLAGTLEVAMGLETAHPQVLDKLNKKMRLQDFERAARFLQRHEIAVRAFLLLRPPFLTEQEGIAWAKRSLDFAFGLGVSCCCIIPTRAGNGALDVLQRTGHFSPPHLSSLEQVLAYGLMQNRGRLFADLWDLELFATCRACLPARRLRLAAMNLTQKIQPEIACDACAAEKQGDLALC